MRRLLFSAFLLFLFSSNHIYAQRDSVRNVFLDAESWFLFEEFADALPLYESLLKSDPGNDNLKYKIGICLLNDPYQKDKSIAYLLEASKNINPSYKENSLKERSAPPDALYYLGNAYLVNELLDRAIESYEEFLEVMDHNIYDEELVLAQIRSCENAQRLKTMPVDLDLLLLDSLINTRYADIHPVVSGDGTKMAFVTELPFYDGAFYTEKTEDGWSYPQMITQMLGFDADVYPVALSHDGTEMILYYDDEYIGNLYHSRMNGGLWMPATKMGEHISTKYWESHASYSKDGRTLYFTSNRKGTLGGLDIYISEKQADGKWGAPVNLGSTINTRYNEECPYISEDGQTLYFSSYGHYNMGGYDVFYSRKKADGSWAEPVNMGYPINTTDDDLFFQPFNNGKNAYFSIYSPRGIGQHDIYYMNIYSVNNPRLYAITGTLRTEDGAIDSNQMVVYVIDADNGDTISHTMPDKDGEFALQLKKGIYELHFQGEGYEDLIKPLRITSESDKRGIVLQDNMVLSLIEEKVDPEEEAELFEGEDSQIKLRQTKVEEVAGMPVVVPVIAPKGSVLVVRTYQDGVLMSTDTLITEKRKTELQIIPLPGTSEVELELTDKDGNIHRNRILVIGNELMDTGATEEEPLQNHEPNIIPEELILEDIVLVAEALAGEDAELLKSKLIENSQDPLKGYLLELELDAKGINTSNELIKHLQKVAESENFTMEEVREALDRGMKKEGPIAMLLLELQKKSEGRLRAELQGLDKLQEQRLTEKDVFEHLYEQAGPGSYGPEEVDRLLSEHLADTHVVLLIQHLKEQARGDLKTYLEQLDLEADGIYSSQELISHLLEQADKEKFAIEDLRKAMLDSLEHPLEVYRVYEDLLQSSEGSLREILESIDLQARGIYTVEQLKALISSKLKQRGASKKEIKQLLKEHFPGKSGASWPLWLVISVAGAGLIWFIIAWWRRREKGEKQED